MNSEELIKKPKVAVIGAGPTGLVTARHLKDIADVKVIECKDDVGGLWNYSDYNEYNHPNLQTDMFYKLYGFLHGSIYWDLVSNLPKQWMTFKDFCISKDYPNLMTHQQFFLYLKQYAEHFGLYDLIQLNTTVTSVKVDENSEHKYKVTTVPTNTDDGTDETVAYFDYVVVWSGHYSVPMMPGFEGEENFEGNLFHVHSLRKFTKEDFDNKNVLVVGGSVSAWDLAEMLFVKRVSEYQPKKLYYAIRSGDSSNIDII